MYVQRLTITVTPDGGRVVPFLAPPDTFPLAIEEATELPEKMLVDIIQGFRRVQAEPHRRHCLQWKAAYDAEQFMFWLNPHLLTHPDLFDPDLFAFDPDRD